MKNLLSFLILILVVSVGCVFGVREIFRNEREQWNAEVRIASCEQDARTASAFSRRQAWRTVAAYNQAIQLLPTGHDQTAITELNTDPDSALMLYPDACSMLGDPCMGWLEIPHIGARLPVLCQVQQDGEMDAPCVFHRQGTWIPEPQAAEQGNTVLFGEIRGMGHIARQDIIRLHLQDFTAVYAADRLTMLQTKDDAWPEAGEDRTGLTLMAPLAESVGTYLVYHCVPVNDEAMYIQNLPLARQIDQSDNPGMIAPWKTAVLIAVPIMLLGMVVLWILLLGTYIRERRYLKTCGNA